jgi:hypothetical protein
MSFRSGRFGDDEVELIAPSSADEHRTCEGGRDNFSLEAVEMVFVKARDIAECRRVGVNFVL